jgi:hypothetical protein
MRKLLRRLDAYTLATLNRTPAGPPNRRAATPGTGPDRRLDRLERKRIAAELAEFRTPAERLELDLILARHSDSDVREIQDLLPPHVHGRWSLERFSRAAGVGSH